MEFEWDPEKAKKNHKKHGVHRHYQRATCNRDGKDKT
jgi:uncharacterized DUF497 family protein